jgi:hypothetical protein
VPPQGEATAQVPGESLNPDLVQTSIPGLYLPYGTRLEGSIQRAVISSELPCASLFSVLEGGEWRTVSRVTLTGMGDPQWLELLQRGDTQLYVRAISIFRASNSGSTGTTPAPAETPTAVPGTPSGPGEYCVAVVQQVSRQALRAQGQISLTGEAKQFPFCAISEGQASLSLYYEGPGDALTQLKAVFPAVIGEQELVPGDTLELTIWQSGMDLFYFYEQAALAMSGTPPADASEPQAVGFNPGGNFSGRVMIESLVPLTGKVQMDGLISEDSDTPQSFEAGFTCTPPEGLPTDMVDLRPIERPEVSLSLDMHSEIDAADQFMGFTENAAVHLEGVLTATSPDTYQGQWQATGEGSFSGYGSDFQPCLNSWTGTQMLQLDGRLVAGTKLVLNFKPAGEPQIQFENSCGLDQIDPGFFPTYNTQLKGKSSLELAWPPDAAGNAHQTVDGRLPDFGEADFGTWVAVFAK